MKKKVLALLLLTVTAAGLVTSCGKSSAGGDKVIKIAASETPHSEILNQAKDILKEQGYDLQVTVFEDYVQPNNVVEQGEFDANYFQHINYLNSFNDENGTSLAVAENGKIHYEPFGIYAGTKTSLSDIADGITSRDSCSKCCRL